MTVTALILAAGQSRRMGQPKMLLPWGGTTVLGQVIETIQRAGIADILIVTGGARREVESIAEKYRVQTVFNADFASGEMLSSIQVGLKFISREGRFADGALVVLGDQPQIEERSVRAVVSRFEETGASLVVPSVRMRRGHPWLVASLLWEEILAMQAPESPRDFLNRHASTIEYVNVDSPSILADLDTPEDYRKSKPSP